MFSSRPLRSTTLLTPPTPTTLSMAPEEETATGYPPKTRRKTKSPVSRIPLFIFYLYFFIFYFLFYFILFFHIRANSLSFPQITPPRGVFHFPSHSVKSDPCTLNLTKATHGGPVFIFLISILQATGNSIFYIFFTNFPAEGSNLEAPNPNTTVTVITPPRCEKSPARRIPPTF